MTELTPTQLRVLGIILRRANARLPLTIRAIASEQGVHKHATHSVVLHLRRKGFVEFEYGKIATLRPSVRFIPASELEGAR